MNISYLKISLNQSVFTCLSNCITTLPITLELFKPSKDSARLRDCNEKKFLVPWFMVVFVSDVILAMLPGLALKR